MPVEPPWSPWNLNKVSETVRHIPYEPMSPLDLNLLLKIPYSWWHWQLPDMFVNFRPYLLQGRDLALASQSLR